MSYLFSCKRLFNCANHSVRALRTYNGSLYDNQSFLSLITQRFISSKTEKDDAFTVSYLINSCGYSLESAKSTSKYIHLKSPERADSVIEYFRSIGFSKAQVCRLTQRFPQVLSVLDLHRIIKPKIEFLFSVGMSRNDLARALSANPQILGRSLERQIVPSFEFLKDLLNSDEKAVCAAKLFMDILRTDYQSRIVENVELLRKDYGVPESNILLLLTHLPKVTALKSDRFRDVADTVIEMGISPLKTGFVVGVYVKGVMSDSTWERKLNVYRSFGWTDEEIRIAFVKEPWCMLHSEKKVKEVMDILVNKSGWKSSDIAQSPKVLCLSLKKRIIPRSSVLQFLNSNGLINKPVKVSSVYYYSEKLFLEKFVAPFADKTPRLLELYKELMSQSEQPEISR